MSTWIESHIEMKGLLKNLIYIYICAHAHPWVHVLIVVTGLTGEVLEDCLRILSKTFAGLVSVSNVEKSPAIIMLSLGKFHLEMSKTLAGIVGVSNVEQIKQSLCYHLVNFIQKSLDA